MGFLRFYANINSLHLIRNLQYRHQIAKFVDHLTRVLEGLGMNLRLVRHYFFRPVTKAIIHISFLIIKIEWFQSLCLISIVDL